jgi:hypothetical protein
VQLETAGGRRAIDAFSNGDKLDAQGAKFIEQHDQVPEVATEPVQTPTH